MSVCTLASLLESSAGFWSHRHAVRSAPQVDYPPYGLSAGVKKLDEWIQVRGTFNEQERSRETQIARKSRNQGWN